MSGPLDGIRVLEMANFISGPYAGMLLADLGAEVIKVEQPGSGDPFRGWGERDGAVRPQFSAYNRGKKGITLDLHTDGGRDLYRRVAVGADVLIENFRPGTAERMGVGYDTLRAENERLIYCAMTGMGSSGPHSQRPTYDAIAQALSGLWSVLTDMRNPRPIGPPMADQLTGVYAAYGILGALVARERTGKGQRIEVSMLSASIAFMTEPVANYLLEGEISHQSSRARRSQSYAFLAGDGKPLAIHLSSPKKFWLGLLDAVGRPELAEDPRFVGKAERVRNYEVLHDLLAEIFRTRPRDEWLEILQAKDVPSAPINNIAEVLANPQVQHIGMVQSFRDDGREERLVGFPVAYKGTPVAPGPPPPRLGEHNAEIFGEVGCSEEDLGRLRAEGAI